MSKILKMAGRMVICAACFLAAGSKNALAEDPQRHTWELGSEISWIEYKEELMNEDGMMYGIAGSYTYRGRFMEVLDTAMLKLETRSDWGKVDYDGELDDGTAYTINDVSDYLWELRGLAGYDFYVLTDAIVTPYFGFGYRYLNDDLAKDPAGYVREANYYYSPIGVEAFKPLVNDWAVGGTLEYDLFWAGKQKSMLSDAVPTLSDVENDQESGYGLRGSLRIIKQTDEVDWMLEPFIRYWSIDKSQEEAFVISGTIIGTVTEPENTSTEIGVKLTARF